jgi:outer membrane scaffolding protein for murein synthesis (MipA/OmpV family)
MATKLDKRNLGVLRGALIACLAAPVTTVAALSGTIAGKLGMSQTSLLIGDGVMAVLLFALLIWTLRRSQL